MPDRHVGYPDRSPGLKRRGFLLGSVLIGLLYLASAAPTPFYDVYQVRWHLSSATLTGVFAVYAVTVMLALHILGPLSDRVGRRLVAACGLAIVLLALVVFAVARGVSWIFAARALQGFGVGTGAAPLTASIVEVHPGGSSELAATAAMVASNIGLGAGVLAAGLFLKYVWDPAFTLYVVLAAAFAVAIAACRRLPGVVRHGHRSSFSLPRLSVPKRVRAAFAVYSAGLTVAWAVGGLYLALGPSIAEAVSPARQRLAGDVSVSILGFVGAAVAAGCRRWSAHRQMGVGSPVLVAGLTMVVWSSVANSGPWFLGGSVVLALGWGLVNIASFRSLVGLSEPGTRAGLLAAIYFVSYVAFSVPTVLAGFATDHFGLRDTVVIFGSSAAFITLMASVVIFVLERGHSRLLSPAQEAMTANLPDPMIEN